MEVPLFLHVRITVAAKGHGVMATLDQDSSDTAGRLLRSQDLETLTDVLGDVESKWRAIGVALGLTQHNLETLESSFTVSPLSDMLKLWLQNQKQPTVEHLTIVLQDIGERTTAHRIGKKLLNQRGKCPCVIYRTVVVPSAMLVYYLRFPVSTWHCLRFSVIVKNLSLVTRSTGCRLCFVYIIDLLL